MGTVTVPRQGRRRDVLLVWMIVAERGTLARHPNLWWSGSESAALQAHPAVVGIAVVYFTDRPRSFKSGCERIA